MTATIAPAPGHDLTPLPTKVAKKLGSPVGRAAVWMLAALWTVPTMGLLISSFRPEDDIKSTGWWTWFTEPTNVTLENYSGVLENKVNGLPFSDFFWNTVRIAIPAAVIPIVIAAFAAYAFSWMKFKGRDLIFVLIVGLMVVPLQMCLIPLLQFFGSSYFPDALEGTPTIWIAHAIFGMPLAIFLLKNFIGSLPSEVIEAARVDGASHMTIFVRIVLPLSVPALASLAIFQFLWVWNDLLVSLVFLGGTPDVAPITVRVAELSGSRGSAWYLLSAGAFISMIVPVAVFLALQRYFVRGLLAGGLKG